jgi:hypothetical protein
MDDKHTTKTQQRHCAHIHRQAARAFHNALHSNDGQSGHLLNEHT